MWWVPSEALRRGLGMLVWLSSSSVFPSSFCEQISAGKDTSHWVNPLMTLL